MDIQLNNQHDIALVGNDFVLTETIPMTLAQRLKIRLLTFLGEWYLDVTEGIPYYESILGKNRAKETVDNIFKNAILDDEDVLNIVEFESNISKDRQYNLRFSVKSVSGSETGLIDITL